MKPSKVGKRRGSKTHGWGSMKKHRGAGNRGGRGNAGSGKRADQKKPMYWNSKQPKHKGQKFGKAYFGKHGFYSITAVNDVAINVQDVQRQLPLWVSEKKASKTGEVYTVDLKNVGYTKLLGTGRVSLKLKLSVGKASAKAIEKIAAAGGAVTLTAPVASEETESDEE